MKFSLLAIVILSTIIASCTPARINSDGKVLIDAQKGGKIIIKRESTTRFMLTQSVFGYDDQDYLTLYDGEAKSLVVPSGRHELFIRSNQADRKFFLKLDVKDGDKMCLKIKTSDDLVIVKLIFPFMFWLTNAFELKQEDWKSCSGKV